MRSPHDRRTARPPELSRPPVLHRPSPRPPPPATELPTSSPARCSEASVYCPKWTRAPTRQTVHGRAPRPRDRPPLSAVAGEDRPPAPHWRGPAAGRFRDPFGVWSEPLYRGRTSHPKTPGVRESGRDMPGRPSVRSDVASRLAHTARPSAVRPVRDRKSTRLNSSHGYI